MKNLTDYQEEIHKCSKCGLCQSVCPVYEITGNDCSVSRGKFILLNGIIKGDLKLNKNINKYLDMCLKCNACKNFCPSDIDAREIFLTAKSQYFKTAPESKLIKIFHSKAVFTSVLKLVKMATTTYRFLKIDKLVSKFYPLFLKTGWVGKKIILANEFVGETGLASLKDPSPFTHHPSHQKAVYFKGCVNEFINPSVKNAAEKVLSQMGVEILPLNFECCGVPFLSSGNVEQFKKQAEFNLAQIPEDFDYFLTDCASCQGAFEEYKKVIDDEVMIEKLKKILEKSLNINEFLVKNIKSIGFEKKTSITFHKPCHLESMDFLQELLGKSKNIDYNQMEEFDKCCGFSGEFAIKNQSISAEISKNKAKNALATNSNYILTSCPACKLGLVQGLIENQEFAPVLNLIEFIAMGNIDLGLIEIAELESQTDYPDKIATSHC